MKEIIIPATLVHLGRDGHIDIRCPFELRELMQHMIDQAGPIYEFMVRIGTQWTKRTTGWKSQNHHIHGHVESICRETDNSKSAVMERMKELAVNRGYPTETLVDGSKKPKSETEIDTVEAGHLIDAIHQFADDWAIYLTEE